MGNHKNFIEINGKKYDAATGVMITEGGAKPVVDGIVKRTKRQQAVPVHRGGSGAPKHVTQHSKTLMRQAVKKPVHATTAEVAAAPAKKKPSPQASPKVTIIPRTAPVNPDREKHAHQIKQSAMIHKFGAPQMPAAPVVAPLSVAHAPAEPTATVSTPVTQNKAADLLDRALEAAQSHNEPLYNPKKPLHKRIAKKMGVSGRAVAISTTIVAGLLIGGLYAYQNIPNLAMKVAATRAGFSASMPQYAPAGFTFHGPVQYTAGQVVVHFTSNTDDRTFKLVQQTSSWTSDSLLNNYVTPSGKEYQTYQDRGRTIYIYDGSNATWVNGGVWYQIEGKSNLSSDQLVRIAASL